jgi:hypothetical protein
MSDCPIGRTRRAAASRERKEETSKESKIAENLSSSWSDVQDPSSPEAGNKPTAQIEEEKSSDDKYDQESDNNMSEVSQEEDEEEVEQGVMPESVTIDGETLKLAA